MWSASLAEAGRHGPPRIRRLRTSASPFLRGRLDVPGTIALRAARVPKAVSRTEPRSIDNPVSRVLVLADRVLGSLLGPDERLHPALADEILGQLRATVGPNPELPSRRELQQVRYAPITRGFEPVARLSHEIATRRGVLTSGSGDDASGVLIDVAELWELFLLHCAQRAFGQARVRHGTVAAAAAFLLVSAVDADIHIGRLKPDLLILDREGREHAVIDAKYKRLRRSVERPHGVDRGDLYQLAAYLSGHDVAYGALAYPPGEDGDKALAADRGPWRLGERQEMEFLRLPATEGECVARLRELVS
jgi:5-methylcytosine-specific restriction enzyme subunit McrC